MAQHPAGLKPRRGRALFAAVDRGRDLRSARCRQEGLGPEWFGGKAEGILLRDPERAKAWAALTTRAWPDAPQGWQCLSEADEALGQLPDALTAARKAAALDTKNEDLRGRVLRLERLGAPK